MGLPFRETVPCTLATGGGGALRGPDLLEVVLALAAGGGLAHFLHGRHKKGDEDRNDRDHHQELDRVKPDLFRSICLILDLRVINQDRYYLRNAIRQTIVLARRVKSQDASSSSVVLSPFRDFVIAFSVA
jgi:hypothetical protein